MDQQKIGRFLRALRKETALTQEQLAERLGVTSRSVSRWETGSNLPDLDLLIELADLYGVELREILGGERVREQMNKEIEETARKVADYSGMEKEKLTRRIHWLFLAAVSCLVGSEMCIRDRAAAARWPWRALSSIWCWISMG